MTRLATPSPSLDRWALSLLTDEPDLLALARRASKAADSPVIGGIAVFLHGYRRTTDDVDLLVADTRKAMDALVRSGAQWDETARQLELEGVPVHLVTTAQTGSVAATLVEIQGVPTVGLADLVRFKLVSGLARPDRAQDLADVVELIRRVPLSKSFARHLPTGQRAPFKKLVDAVENA